MRFVPAAVFLFAFALYANTLHHGFVMDDAAYITGNATVQRGLAALPQTFRETTVFGSTGENFGPYRPLTIALFAAEVQLFGNDPHRFHLVQTLLYALLCTVLYLTLRRLLAGRHALLPIVTSLLFAAHPIHTEVAANIKGADEILSLLFCCLSLFWSMRFVQDGRLRQAVAGGVFFVCAMFAKENAVTFVAAIPLALYCFVDTTEGTSTARRRPGMSRLVTVGLYLAAGALLYVATRAVAIDSIPEKISIINNALAEATPGQRYATAAYMLLYYLRLLAWPHPLSWDYGFNQVPLKTWADPFVWGSLLLHAGAVVYALRALRMKRLWAFCILYYLVTLSLTSNVFILILATIGERFLFAPSLAFCLALAAALLAATGFVGASDRRRPAVLMAVLLVVLGFSVTKTVTRNADWRDNYSLFKSGVETSPNSYRTNMTFGWENLKAAQTETDAGKAQSFYSIAATYYRKAVTIYPGIPEDWFNLGLSYSGSQNVDGAIEAYTRVQTLNPGQPASCYNLGAIYVNRQMYPQALENYRCAAAADPDFLDVAFMMGLCYQYLGDPAHAIVEYENYLRRHPENPQVLANLSAAYRALGKSEAADYYAGKLERAK